MKSVLLLTLLSGCSCRSPKSSLSDASHVHRIDMHVHVESSAMPVLLRLMDAYGIAQAVNLSGGWPGAGLEETVAAARQTNGRVLVFATPPFHALAKGLDPRAIAAELTEAKRLGARGIKIFKALGLSYRWPDGSLIAVDDPRLDSFFDEAGQLGLPVAIHTGDPKAFWLPVDDTNERIDELTVHPSWSNAGKQVPSWDSLYRAFLARVARHPHTTFIGVHFGNAPEDIEAVTAALDAHSNLYIDTAARVPELGRQPPARMHALFAKHADRVLFGTDLGVGTGGLMLGSAGAEPPTSEEVERFFRSTWRYFETNDVGFEHPTPIQGRWTISGVGLSASQLEALYHSNAHRLLGGPSPQ